MTATNEFWNQKQKHPLAQFTAIGYFIFVVWAFGRMESFGHATLHLRPEIHPLVFAAVFIFGRTLIVVVHEFGHGLLALLVGFHVQNVKIGPLQFNRHSNGRLISQFNWSRLLDEGGYWGAVPATEQHVRSKMIILVLGGPLASLTTGALLWLAIPALQGSAWEPYWDTAGLMAVLFVADCFWNLIPIGYRDGTMLLHLIFWTRRGKDLCALLVSSIPARESREKSWQGDYEDEVALRRESLERLKQGSPPANTLAMAYVTLGFAQMNAGIGKEAIASLKEGLAVLRRGPGNALIEASAGMGLYKVYSSQHRSIEAYAVFEDAIGAFERAKSSHPDAVVEIQLSLADLHADNENYQLSLAEVKHGLLLIRATGKNTLNRARFFAIRAACELRLGQPERGMTSAAEAVRLLDSTNLNATDRGRAAIHLSTLGTALWEAGRDAAAERLLLDSARRFQLLGRRHSASLCMVQRAAVLRNMGRLSEAEAALPVEDQVEPKARASYYAERAEIRRLEDRLDEALADCEQALRVATEQSHEASKLATQRALLAEIHLEAGRADEARAMAQNALAGLVGSHPDRAGALVTLALLCKDNDPECSERQLKEAFGSVEESPFLAVASRARALETMARRLERHGGPPKFAEAWRRAAAQHWRNLGVEKETAA